MSATDADSFKFWEGYYRAILDLPTAEQRGEFIVALCQAVFDGVEDPEVEDVAVRCMLHAVADSARKSKLISREARAKGKASGVSRRNRKREHSSEHSSEHSLNNGSNSSLNVL